MRFEKEKTKGLTGRFPSLDGFLVLQVLQVVQVVQVGSHASCAVVEVVQSGSVWVGSRKMLIPAGVVDYLIVTKMVLSSHILGFNTNLIHKQ
jgi:hypothetical protein